MNLSEFQRKIAETGNPVVIDFWAPWCVPCQVTKPILEKLASEYEGKVEFLPVNTDDSRDVLAQFQVIGIPTVLALQDATVVGRVTGAQTDAGYRAMFESLATGRKVKIPMSSFDRMLRLGAGTLLVMVGISTGGWLPAVIGATVAFLGIYDRCPVWSALTGLVQRK
jgi:thioredoxin 1